MTAESVQEMARRQPFEPFVIKVSGGGEYVIRHPEMVMPTQDYVVVAIPPPPDSGKKVFERVTWVSVLHIIELTPLVRPEASINNGKK